MNARVASVLRLFDGKAMVSDMDAEMVWFRVASWDGESDFRV